LTLSHLQICKTYGKNPLSYLDNEKKPDLDELGKGLRILIDKVLKYFKTVSEPYPRIEEKLIYDNQERLEFLEKELKAINLVKEF
jgi:hypothetical protein